MKITEENHDILNEEGIYIAEEEDNNEVYNTDIENNEDANVMNKTNDGIRKAE